MPKSRPVVVAVDMQPGSERLILWACEFAQSAGASVFIVHVVHDPGSEPGFYGNSQYSKKPLEPIDMTAERMMGSLLDRMRADNSDLSSLSDAEMMLVSGLPQSRIIEIVEDKDAQLLVIGHRKRNGLQRLWEGSVAEHLMQTVNIPVVVV